MAITLESNEFGELRIGQELQRPAVYLDHWAVREFAEDLDLQDRFIAALHRSKGTWLFSTANLMEYTAMSDLEQAAAAERLLSRAMPAMHFADLTLDPGYLIEEGAPLHEDAPQRDWMLADLADRAKIAGGVISTHHFIQEAIKNRDTLLILFQELKTFVTTSMMSLTQDAHQNTRAKKFIPTSDMSMRVALYAELLREPHIDSKYVFDENDAMDFLHSISVLVCDFVLLDAHWCHKVERAAVRIRKGGVSGNVARCFSKKHLNQFLSVFEELAESTTGSGRRHD